MADSDGNAGERSVLGRRIGFWGGIGAFLLILIFCDFVPEQPLVTKVAAVAVLMAIWWTTDAVPLAATSLLPLVLYPVLGIMKGKAVAPVYVNYIIFLFIGGFLIALAMERWQLHRRIALNIVNAVGGSPARLVLGFMLATAFLSMWISNTATTIMMVAMVLAVIKSMEATFGEKGTASLAIAMLLGVAYSASIGGMATLVGTPPNLALARIYEELFPDATDTLSFGQWLIFGLPLAIILVTICWLLLTKVFYRPSAELVFSKQFIREEKAKLGKISFEEMTVLAVFAGTALLWVFRKKLSIGPVTIPGWTDLPFIKNGPYIDDGTIAICMALLLFLIPTRSAHAKSEGYGTVLDFGVFSKIPWHIVLLLGGGFALAKGIGSSGLSQWVGSGFESLDSVAPHWFVLAICSCLTFLTELTSNTATTEMLLPILASISQSVGIHPLVLMIPATLSASCAFMMPVATAPNAIVFGSGKIKVLQMVKVGIVMNLIGIVVIVVLFCLFGPLVFGFDLSS